MPIVRYIDSIVLRLNKIVYYTRYQCHGTFGTYVRARDRNVICVCLTI